MSELGKIAHDAFYESFERPYTGYDVLDEGLRNGWDAAGGAIAAHVANPTAEDYDAAAEGIAARRYALVEQMGHRSTVGSVRETTFCGRPMLAVTNLRTGAEHLVSPESLYEITWLTEDEARSRAKPWTAAAITAGAQEDSDPWLGDEDDEASYQARRAAEADL